MKFRFVLPLVLFITAVTLLGCSDDVKSKENLNSDAKVVPGIRTEAMSEKYYSKPPGLTILTSEATIKPTLGTYSWSYVNDHEEKIAINSDSLSPPSLVGNHNPKDVTSETNLELQFDKKPESYTIKIWHSDNHVESGAEKIVLSEQKGKVIYEVLAHWEQGTASYAFPLNIE